MNPTFTLGQDATLWWRAPAWLTAAPTLRVTTPAGVVSNPAMTPVVPVDDTIEDDDGNDLNACAKATALAGDRRTLTIDELALSFTAGGDEGDVFIRDHGGSVFQARIGTIVSDTSLRLSDPLRDKPEISVAKPAAIQWVTYSAPLSGAAELATAGKVDYRITYTARGGQGAFDGALRVMRRFGTGLDLHRLYTEPGGASLAAQQTRRNDHQPAIDSALRTLARWVRRDLAPNDETMPTDGHQFLDAHIALVHHALATGPEQLGVRAQYMAEAKEAYDDALRALLVDRNGDGRTDSTPFSTSHTDFRSKMPSTLKFKIRRT